MNFTTRLHQHVLFPFLFPLFFVLHTAVYFSGLIPVVSASAVLLLYVGITFILFLAIRKSGRHGAGAGLSTLLFMILFAHWGELVNWLNKILHTGNYTYLPILFFGWVALSLLLGRTLNSRPVPVRQKVVFYLNALFILYILVDAILLCYGTVMLRRQRPMVHLTALPLDGKNRPDHHPNVYLLLFDEYASSAALQNEWGFNNSSIDTALQRRHFKVNTNSSSNYHMTFYSMASMLNMDYLDTTFEQNDIHFSAHPKLQRWLNNPRVMRIFLNAGYQFRNLSIFDMDGQPGPDLRDIFVNRGDLLTVNNLFHITRKFYIPYLKNRNALRNDPNFHDPAFYHIDGYNNMRVDDVLAEAKTKRPTPKFVYAHILSPHAPYYYDSIGQYLPVSVAKASNAIAPAPLYLNAVRHTNEIMLRMVDAIMQHEKGKAVILVLSDHGFRTKRLVVNSPALFSNYSAIYFPDQDYRKVPDSLTNVNVFRMVFNQFFGNKYPILPTRHVVLREVAD